MRSAVFALCLLFLVLFAVPALSGEFVLGAEDAAGPWGQADGSGAGNEIVAAAFEAAGERVRLEVLPYARAKSMALEGRLAGCFAMAWEPSLQGSIVFADDPLYSVRAVFFENPDNPLKASSVSDFPATATLGIVTGYEYPPEVGHLRNKGVRFVESTSEENNLRHLAGSRMDSTVLVLDSLKNEELILRKAGVQRKVRRVFEAGGQGSFVGFSLKHPQGLKAKEVFDRGFAIIKTNGVYRTILERWQKKSFD